MGLDLKKVFKKKETKEEKSELDQEIDAMIEALKGVDGESEQYAKICDNTKRLVEMKVLMDGSKEAKPEDIDRRNKLNINTIVTVGGYLVGMVLVLFFEADGGVIATKALQFLPKPRI